MHTIEDINKIYEDIKTDVKQIHTVIQDMKADLQEIKDSYEPIEEIPPEPIIKSSKTRKLKLIAMVLSIGGLYLMAIHVNLNTQSFIIASFLYIIICKTFDEVTRSNK